jgi:hypothetical protein
MHDNIKTPMTLKTTDVYVGAGDMRRAAEPARLVRLLAETDIAPARMI